MAEGKGFWAFLLFVVEERNSKPRATQEKIPPTESLCPNLLPVPAAAAWGQGVHMPSLSPVTPVAHERSSPQVNSPPTPHHHGSSLGLEMIVGSMTRKCPA